VHHNRLGLLPAGLLVATLVIACGGGGSSPPPPPQRDSTFFANLEYTIPEAEVAAILGSPQASDYVKGIVGDGRVTFAEYEAAALQTLNCARSIGYESRPGDPRLSARGLYTWSLRTPPIATPILGNPGPEHRAQFDQLVACMETYFNQVDFYWIRVVEPSEQEKAAAMEDLAVCMEQAGLADYIPPSRAYDSFYALQGGLPDGLRQLYRQCARATQEKWALPKFTSEQWED
jgi:hypothetical protein